MLPAGESLPGDVIAFAGGREVTVARVAFSQSPGAGQAAYVTVFHASVRDGLDASVPVVTICMAETLVRLAGHVRAAEGVAA